MKRVVVYFPLAVVSLLMSSTICSANDAAYWLTVNSSDFEITENIKTRAHGEFRFPEAEYMSYFRLSQKFYTKLSKNWTLGTHPTIEGSRLRGSSDWKNTYRLDLELNPKKMKLGENGPTLSLRNRWEVRWKEGKGSEVFNRIRQYSKVSWKTGNNVVNSYAVANEIFYEVDKSMITMNRFYPVVLGVPIMEGVSSSFYFLYQTKRVGTSDSWNETYIGGVSLKF